MESSYGDLGRCSSDMVKLVDGIVFLGMRALWLVYEAQEFIWNMHS